MSICRRQFSSWMLGGLVANAFPLPPRLNKLLVLVILEQLRPDYLDAVSPQLRPGGLRRLLRKGAYFPDCRHQASTFSASSIATLATGAWPSQHGIVAGTWYDPAAKKPASASSDALLATTLCEQIAADPRNRVFVVSMDLSLGSLFAGTAQARQFWMDQSGQFGTLGSPPDWLTNYNNVHPIENAHNAKWMAVNPSPGAPPLRTLTFDPSHPQEFLNLYKASPFCQEAQFMFLSELIARERIGQGDTFDFVCLLAESSSLLGYETGARSPLMQQMTLQLDLHLEFLLNQLNGAPGENAFNLVLAGAHGAPPLPSPESRARLAVNGEAVAQAVDRTLAATGGGRVLRYLYPFLYLDHSGFRDPEPIRVAAGRAALEQPAVAGYYTAGGACSIRDGWQVRYRNSFHPKRSG